MSGWSQLRSSGVSRCNYVMLLCNYGKKLPRTFYVIAAFISTLCAISSILQNYAFQQEEEEHTNT